MCRLRLGSLVATVASVRIAHACRAFSVQMNLCVVRSFHHYERSVASAFAFDRSSRFWLFAERRKRKFLRVVTPRRVLNV